MAAVPEAEIISINAPFPVQAPLAHGATKTITQMFVGSSAIQ